MEERPVIYSYDNGNRAAIWLAGVLLLCLFAIQGFVGAKVWLISERLARIEGTISVIANQ